MKKTINVLLIFYMLLMTVYLSTHQYYNADIEAYMGIVYKTVYPNMSVDEIHKKVYDELREKKPERLQFDSKKDVDAVGDSKYYKILSENSKAYGEELQLFTVKPFYNFVNSIFFRIGFSASASTYIVTIISYILIVLLLYIFLLKIVENQILSFFITVLLSLFKPLLDASRHATPDVLACFLLLLSFYFVIIRRNLFISTIIGMLCIFTRPDYFIFYFFCILLLFVFRKNVKLKTLELFFALVYFFLSFALIQYFNQISWSVLFMNQFTKVQIFPISHPDLFNFSDYISCIKSKILLEFNSSYFILLLVFVVLIMAKKYTKVPKDEFIFYISFLFVIYLTVFIRFFIFPSLVNRMMLGYYLLIILSLIHFQYRKN
jgi:hypothetical protein